MPRRLVSIIWIACFLGGFATVAHAVLSAPAPGTRPDRGLDVRLLVNQSGAVAVAPVGDVLAGHRLKPGRRLRARLSLTNITPQPLTVRLRAASPTADADQLLEVRIVNDSRVVFSGPLARLRRWTSALRLRAGQKVRLRITLWVPDGNRGGFTGRVSDITLETATRRARR